MLGRPALGQPVSALTVYFAARIGGGSVPPADGYSFVWAPSNDIPSTLIFGEGGAGGGLIVGFDIYNNAGEAPSFNVVYHASAVAAKLVDISALETGDNFGDVFIQVSSAGLLDLQYNGKVIFYHLPLPGYASLAGGVFAFGARTGGLNENQWFDNIETATGVGSVTTPPTLGWSRDGSNLRLTWPAGFKLQSTASLNSPITWTDVTGAASPYTVNTSTGTAYYRLASVP